MNPGILDVDSAAYIYQKLQHCIKSGYTDLALEYLDKFVDIMVGEDD